MECVKAILLSGTYECVWHTGVVLYHLCVLRRNCIVADSVKVGRLLKRLSLFVHISVPKESLSARADLK